MWTDVNIHSWYTNSGNVMSSIHSINDLAQYYKNLRSHISIFDSKIHSLISISSLEPESSFLSLPMHGMPLLVKDVITTANLPTTAGIDENFVKEDATVVKILQKKGFFVLGKTNTPEYAMDYQTFNSIGPACNNPYNMNYTPGGSSGGTAAALAMRFGMFGLGTDLGGSLRQPASFCGVYSLRPTFGLISNDGIIYPEQFGEDFMSTIGPMATDITGLNLIWECLVGIKGKLDKPNFKLLLSDFLEEIPIDRRIVESISQLQMFLDKKGIHIEVIHQFDISSAEEVYLGLFNAMSNTSNDKGDTSFYLSKQKDFQNYLLEVLGEYDAWILPVCSILPFKHNPQHMPFYIDKRDQISLDNDGRKLNYWVANGMYCRPGSASGFPVITIPLNMVDGLPVGIQILGKPGEDQLLLAIAQEIDNMLGRRIKKPELLDYN